MKSSRYRSREIFDFENIMKSKTKSENSRVRTCKSKASMTTVFSRKSTSLLLLSTYLLSNQTSAQSCQPGQYLDTSTGQNFCETCPAGSSCDGSPTTTTCQPGEYSTGGSSTCTECPIGYYCPVLSLAFPLICTTGTYTQTTKSLECTICPAGSYCPIPSQTTPSNCPTGFYSKTGAKVCTICPAGVSCSVDGSSILFCESGQYSLEGDSICQDCSTGNSPVDCPEIDSDQEISCPANFFKNTTENNCEPCPAGKDKTDTTSNACAACDVNYYSLEGRSCQPCPKNKICPGQMFPELCDLGKYPSIDQLTCIECPMGQKCEIGVSKPVTCPAGFRGDNGTRTTGSSSCVKCEDGYDCSNPLNILECTTVNYNGKFCSGGNVFKCPLGTYFDASSVSLANAAKNVNDCKTCAAGKYCENYDLQAPTGDCPSGYFCPEGTSNPYQNPCHPGTFTATGTSGCTACSAGSFCKGGESQPVTCPKGYYCKAGADQFTAYLYPCPSGTYGNNTGYSNLSECTACPEGSYCVEASTGPTPCPAGTYTEVLNTQSKATCKFCTAGYACPIGTKQTPGTGTPGDPNIAIPCAKGHYCPVGTRSAFEFPCPPGTFNDLEQQINFDKCLSCEATFFCSFGETRETMTANVCPKGSYCPVGTTEPIACPAGSYNLIPGKPDLADCLACKAGFYCGIGTIDYEEFPCEPGFYCEQGTESSTENPCQAGTFNANFQGEDSSACQACIEGHYCEVNTVVPTACPAGTFRSTKGARSTAECNSCTAGFYCENEATIDASLFPCQTGEYSEEGSEKCESCSQGYFCAVSGTSLSLMLSQPCTAGYYCDSGSTSATSMDCPAGFYCPISTPLLNECPLGTYNILTNKDSVSDCLPCTAGFYCEPAQSVLPENHLVNGQRLICGKGHVCPTGISIVSDTYLSDPHIPSIIGSTGRFQEPCEPGTFLDETGGTIQSDCKNCPIGFYCPEGSSSPIDCPAGYYCTDSTFDPFPCPKGTYSDQIRLTEKNDCTLCTIGKYCDGDGLTQPRGPCDPGFQCYQGSNTSQPEWTQPCDQSAHNCLQIDDVDGFQIGGRICPQGYYCLTGTIDPVICQPGTFNDLSGQTDNTNCRECDEGKFCNGTNPDAGGIDCPEGFHCPQGSVKPLECGIGKYCPTGTGNTPNSCKQGTFQQGNTESSCEPCPPGTFCIGNSLIETQPCQKGSYCPQFSENSPAGQELDFYNANKNNYVNVTVDSIFGTFSSAGYLCPQGTYQPLPSQSSSDSCLNCPPGKYCSEDGAIAPTGKCSDGYICVSNSITPAPNDNSSLPSATGYPCPPGHYCNSNSLTEIPCPEGTFRGSTLGTEKSSCGNCTAGSYCATTGLTQPTGTCDLGFFCEVGSKIPDQNPCPVGFYCNGKDQPKPCSEGEYQDQPQQDSCKPCEGGFTCLFDSTAGTTVKEDCPGGFYCPENSSGRAVACPLGTFNLVTTTKQVSEENCQICPGGKACNSLSTTEPISLTQGYYSQGGSKSTTPSDISSCNPFDLETAVLTCATTNCNDCGKCPAGFYCPEETEDYRQFPCPVGTFGASSGLFDSSECTACSPGKYCPNPGMIESDLFDCEFGFLCESGCATPRPDENDSCGSLCEAMFECPIGATTKVACASGFESNAGSASCSPCEEGYFCKQNSSGVVEKQVCPEYYYCETGTINPAACPAGTYSSVTQLTNPADCTPCPEGVFCPDEPTKSPNPCTAGFICESGLDDAPPNSAKCPVNSCCDNGIELACPDGRDCDVEQLACQNLATRLCPAGFYCKCELGATGCKFECPSGQYCPTGSSSGIDCPAGTYSFATGASDNSTCLECPEGKYCVEGLPGLSTTRPTQISDLPSCDNGFYCETGSSNPQQFNCTEGFKCLNGLQESCPVSTYQPYKNSDSCFECEPGYFCDSIEMTEPTICPISHFCDGVTTSRAQPCNPGQFNKQQGMISSDSCEDCSLGQYCPQTDSAGYDPLNCTAGYHCDGAAQDEFGRGRTNSPNECGKGYFCPEGTPEEIPCPEGFYSDKSGQIDNSTCKICTTGNYCPIGASSLQKCSAGVYCPAGSTDNETPCPLGYYCLAGNDKQACPSGSYAEIESGISQSSGGVSRNGCTECPPGRFCRRTGSEDPITYKTISDSKFDCQAGYYCESNSGFNSLSSDCRSNQNKGACPCNEYKYCPINTSKPYDCPDGTFVTGTGNENCDNCTSGSYCSTAFAPSNIQACPRGFYCPEGTGRDQKACPPGTYQPGLSKTSDTDCLNCTAGYGCPYYGLTISNQFQCKAGHYCPERSVDAYGRLTLGGEETICPEGHFCPAGSSSPQKCEPSTWQPLTQQSECIDCTAGTFCSESGTGGFSDIDNSLISPTICPIGSYCGSASSEPSPCRIGTYGVYPGISTDDECPNCKPGKYCDTTGMNSTLMEGNDCPAGYYCPLGTSNPTNSRFQCAKGNYCETGSSYYEACPKNYYCGEKLEAPPGDDLKCDDGCICESGPTSGATKPCPANCVPGFYCTTGNDPVICPAGTFNTGSRGSSINDCTNCTSGYYCPDSGQSTEPSLLCPAGFICDTGTSVVSVPCEKGFACPGRNGNPGNPPSACHNGFYQPNEGQSECVPCSAGSYCPENSTVGLVEQITVSPGYFSVDESSVQTLCTPGTFSNAAGSADNCQPCPPGKYCEQPGVSDVTSFECDAGYFCKSGSSSKTPFEISNNNNEPMNWGNGPCPTGYFCGVGTEEPTPCPIGTYNPVTGQSDRTDCQPCDYGLICDVTGLDTNGQPCGAGYDCSNSTKLPCPAGFYCTENQVDPTPCSPGKYNPNVGQSSSIDCLDCPAGSFCQDSNTTVPTSCPIGSYCPIGRSNPVTCQKNTMNVCEIENLACPNTCPEGTFSTDGQTCITCKPGSVCQITSVEPCGDRSLQECPRGRYCDGSDPVWGTPCPSGTFSNQQALTSVSECTNCTSGSYCSGAGLTTPTGVCEAGYFCDQGSTTPKQFQCQPGTFCVSGSKTEQPCTFGQYNVNFAQSQCAACPAGYFCNSTGIATTDELEICPPGSFCVTESSVPEPCVGGSFREQPGATDSNDCTVCPAGKYCIGGGTGFDGECPDGAYCLEGTSNPVGFNCTAGNFCTCDGGCQTQIPCLNGFACPDQAMKFEDILACEAGFYCLRGSETTRPAEDTGDFGPCKSGYFCPAGKLIPCPVGTYGTGIGGDNQTVCQTCDEGFFCDSTAQSGPTDVCTDGFYCPPGSTSSKMKLCPPGHKCASGIKTPCSEGEFQTNAGIHTDCEPCFLGHVCDGTGLLEPSGPCPAGNYCDEGSTTQTANLCTVGTYNNRTGGSDSTVCLDCPPGKACQEFGLTDDYIDCEAGFYCMGGSESSFPSNDDTFDPPTISNGPCPAGHYCEIGTSFPTPCPTGTYLASQFGESVADCQPCPGGYLCNELAISVEPDDSMLCPAGFYCEISSSAPIDCPVGNFCEIGSSQPSTCSSGFYQPNLNAENEINDCMICPAGYFCTRGLSNVDKSYLCSPGFKCPEGSSISTESICDSGYQCPAGSPENVPCPPGFFTDRPGQSTCQICTDGFNCQILDSQDTTTKSSCDLGFYCQSNVINPIPCRIGTYGTQVQASVESETCQTCPAGFYCDKLGMIISDVTLQPVSAGFFCQQGCTVEKPFQNVNCVGDCVGDICPTGFQCPTGAIDKQNCDQGQYQDKEGQSVCVDCPAGFYCRPDASGASLAIECPKGHFCPRSTANYEPNRCPSGTYFDKTGAQSENQCTICQPGQYCAGTGNEEVGDDCAQGYYCPEGSETPAPSDAKCNPGFYCPTGEANQLSCPPGKYCQVAGLGGTAEDLPDCEAGFYCPSESTSPTEKNCPTGFYCEVGVGEPAACPVGTFNPDQFLRSKATCTQCTEGFYCETPGLSAVSGPCSPGFFCPEGSMLQTEVSCPAGSFCDSGVSESTVCPAGTCQSNAEQDDCPICPAGFTCDENCITPEVCPEFKFCESGTEFGSEENCPDGKYSPANVTGNTSENDCLECVAGNYCLAGATIGSCDSGYYCDGGSFDAQENICPIGFYCENGIKNACPDGTYSKSTGTETANDCEKCDPGFYCFGGQSIRCDPGYVCTLGSSSATPVDGAPSNGVSPATGTGFACTLGNYCPDGENMYPCERGKWQPETAQDSCRNCLPGFYCPANSAGIADLSDYPCQAGYWCVEGQTNPNSNGCPKGTFSNVTQQETNTCTDCPNGRGCPGGVSDPFASQYECQAGSYCPQKSTSTSQQACSTGHFCPTGTEYEIECPPGTYNPSQGRSGITDCLNCPGGNYCKGGNSEPTGFCEPATFCDEITTNRFAKDSGEPCPNGKCCPEGTDTPISCALNSYSNEPIDCVGTDFCTPCPAGKECLVASGTIAPIDCSVKYFCEEGVSPQFCKDGTYSNSIGLASQDECDICPTGYGRCGFRQEMIGKSDSVIFFKLQIYSEQFSCEAEV